MCRSRVMSIHVYVCCVSRSTQSMNSTNPSFDVSRRIIQHLICPPPPRPIERLSRQELRQLVVPKPDQIFPNEQLEFDRQETKENDQSTLSLERLLKNVDELSRYCRPSTTLCSTDNEPMKATHPSPRIKPLSNAQRIRKVIFELIETERSYVQVGDNR
jgi:hypothetical protein